MELKQVWVLLPAVVGFAAVALVVWLVLRRRGTSGTVAVANSELLRSLPEFQRAVSRHRTTMLAAAGVALLVGALALVGAARPLERTVVAQSRDNRDIVLCLDVSGSMLDVDTQVVSTFQQLAEGFRGERISMVIFEQHRGAGLPPHRRLRVRPRRARQGPRGAADGRRHRRLLRRHPQRRRQPRSSATASPRACCSFDHPEIPRARSVILATDNEAAGRSLFSLTEAGQLARQQQIQVYGINPSDSPASSASGEMSTVVSGTGGVYYALDDLEAVPQILKAVTSREASRIPTTPQLVVSDTPGLLIGLAGLGVGVLLVLRRLRWRP